MIKKLSKLILATLLFAGCNNVDEILSNFKNIIPEKNKEEITTVKEASLTKDQEYDHYKYQDICDLFF